MAEFDLGTQNAYESLVFPGFLDKIASAAAHGFHGDVNAAPSGHDDHRQRAVQRLDFREQR